MKKLFIFVIITRLLILILPYFFNLNLTAWNRWDAPHYLYIAEHWYTNVGDEANFIVFFPLYPLIIRNVFSGIFISSILFIAGCYLFYKLIQIDFSKKVAGAAIIIMAIFPTSYFFNAPYTESLFLFLFAVSFYAARKSNWILAGLAIALACITRPFGILILPAILVEWFVSKEHNYKSLPIIIFPSIFSISSYLYLNWSIYGNIFEFQKILANHWQKNFMSPIASIVNTWRIAPTIALGWFEAITITLSWIIIPFAFKYLRKSWALYYTLSIILFSSTSFILSTPRYLLSIPPIFVLIALAEKNVFFKFTWRFISIILLFYFATLFARGQWAF